MPKVGLTLHPEKTRMSTARTTTGVVSTNTPNSFSSARGSGNAPRGPRTELFVSFLPAISKPALKKISAQVRSWRLHHRTNLTEEDLAERSTRSCRVG